MTTMSVDNAAFELQEPEMDSAEMEKHRISKEAEASGYRPTDIMYGIDDKPPWYLSLVLGMQHYLTMIGSTVSIPFIICPALCIEKDDPARGYIISTILFVSGIVTLLQSTFGVRLPIVQGGTFAFLAPTFAILSLERNQCPADFDSNGWGNMSYEDKTEEWQRRMREVQGAIAVASVFQLLIGYLGIIGAILNYITPLTIAPAVSMIGLALFPNAADLASKHWGISGGTILLMIVLSQYLRNIGVPLPTYSRQQGCGFEKVDIFKLFPVLFTMLFMWGLCFVLTATDVFPAQSPARTDLQVKLIQEAVWIRFPYPFQWGVPTVTVAGVFGILAGVIASAIESVGDYYACARLSGAPPPPTHAINRGIGTEGLGCILAGIWGTGNGTTSYSENIGAIGVTKVGSRRVIQFGAIIMLVFGLFSKIGAAFITIPEPIVGGMFCVMFGMIAAVGLSNLQFVDLNSSRNLFILGFSIFFGLLLPFWVKANPSSIATGNDVFDQIVRVLLETSMFVSGLLGFVLDNTVPGTLEERGLIKWRAQMEPPSSAEAGGKASTYDFPIGMKVLRRQQWAKYIPFFPTYDANQVRDSCAGLLPKSCTKRSVE